VACALLAPKLSSPAESNAYFWSVMGLKCTISVVYNVIYVYAAEYVPSKVRGFAIGMGSASARIGGIATPYAMVLLHRSHIALPYWFMVGACTVGLMASLVMVEVGKHMR
jgi:sugar phosphate permease